MERFGLYRNPDVAAKEAERVRGIADADNDGKATSEEYESAHGKVEGERQNILRAAVRLDLPIESLEKIGVSPDEIKRKRQIEMENAFADKLMTSLLEAVMRGEKPSISIIYPKHENGRIYNLKNIIAERGFTKGEDDILIPREIIPGQRLVIVHDEIKHRDGGMTTYESDDHLELTKITGDPKEDSRVEISVAPYEF